VKKRGSITVFLSLVLILLFSLVVTTIEAARLKGAQAYVQMLSCMAGDSVKAMYYYPLFEQYGLLGVLSGDKEGYFSEDKIEKSLKTDLTYGLSGLGGGMLKFSEPSIEVTGVKTMLTSEAEELMKQIKLQAVLEGVGSEVINGIADNGFEEVAVIGKVHKKQEEALQQTATVTRELLRLMELLDGVKTDKNGLSFDKEGNLRTTSVFLKRICALTEEERKEKYTNKEVYEAIKNNFYSPKALAEELLLLLEKGVEFQAEVSVCDLELAEYRKRKNEIKEELSAVLPEEEKRLLQAEGEILSGKIRTTVERRDELIEWLDISAMDMEEKYGRLKKELEQLEPLLKEALEILSALENKQFGAKLSVDAYEEFLKEIEKELSKELYEVFWGELQRIKIYAGMSEEGWQVSKMRKTLEANQALLEELKLVSFSPEQLREHSVSVKRITERIEEYSVDGLWLPYGKIVVQKTVQGNVFLALEQVITGSILALAGVEEGELSGRYLEGQALPSAGYSTEFLQTELLACFEEISSLFQKEGALRVLKAGGTYATDVLALEWYLKNYFGCYGSEKEGTRIAYEREYLLFGEKGDRRNLLSAVLYLVAIRMLFSMTAIWKDAGKMSQLELAALSMAGFTGIPALVSVLKYSLLLLWSMEEAFIEVAMLLDGKKVPLISMDSKVDFAELFTFSPLMVKKKVAGQAGVVGRSYEEYLQVLSLLKGKNNKLYRAMDLIQENIRYRYQDGFRMKNVVTEVAFRVETVLEQKIQTKFWKEEIYRILSENTVTY